MRKKKKKKGGPEYPGEGASKTAVAGPIFDDFCIIQAKITYLGLLLVPINRDTLISLKTENRDVEEHNTKRRKSGGRR